MLYSSVVVGCNVDISRLTNLDTLWVDGATGLLGGVIAGCLRHLWLQRVLT
jgi:hypothetical protein